MEIIESDFILNWVVFNTNTSVLSSAICLNIIMIRSCLTLLFFTGKFIIIFYDAIIILIGVILEKPFRNIENVEQWTLFLVISIRNIIDNIQYYTLEWRGCFRNNEMAPQYSNTNRDNTSCSYHLSFQQIFDSFSFLFQVLLFSAATVYTF